MPDLNPDEVARKDFSLGFRGFDQGEVRGYLAWLAAELAAGQDREARLSARIEELEEAATGEPDEAMLEVALGREATRVLHAAREAAGEIRARAEAEAAAALADAEAAARARTTSADEAAGALASEIEAAVAAQRSEAERRAAAVLEEAQERASATLAEATAERDRVAAEIARLQAARDRLAASFEDVRRALQVSAPAEPPSRSEAVDTGPVARFDLEVAEAPPDEPEEATPEPPERSTAEGDADLAARREVDAGPPPDVRAVRPAGGTPVAPPADDEVEGVRIIGGATPAPMPVAEAPSPIEVDVAVDAHTADEDERGGEPGREDAPGVDDADDAAASDDVEDPDRDERGAGDSGAGDAAGLGEAPPATEEPGAPPDTPAVAGLFARLRADRAEKVATANALLAGGPDEAAPARRGGSSAGSAAAADAAPATRHGGDERAADEPGAPDVDAASDTDEGDDGDELEPDLAVLAARDDAVVDAERSLLRSIKRALADEQNEVLDALRRLRSRPSLDALLPDAAAHDARYEAALGGGATAAADAGGSGAGGSQVAVELGRSIAEDLRLRVGRAVDEAGGDVDTLAEAISATYREWKTARSEPLARDVITAGYAAGAYGAAHGPIRWVVDPAEGGCPDCDDNALAGPTERGVPFPTGQLHPPAHAGCRCLAVPAT